MRFKSIFKFSWIIVVMILIFLFLGTKGVYAAGKCQFSDTRYYTKIKEELSNSRASGSNYDIGVYEIPANLIQLDPDKLNNGIVVVAYDKTASDDANWNAYFFIVYSSNNKIEIYNDYKQNGEIENFNSNFNGWYLFISDGENWALTDKYDESSGGSKLKCYYTLDVSDSKKKCYYEEKKNDEYTYYKHTENETNYYLNGFTYFFPFSEDGYRLSEEAYLDSDCPNYVYIDYKEKVFILSDEVRKYAEAASSICRYIGVENNSDFIIIKTFLETGDNTAAFLQGSKEITLDGVSKMKTAEDCLPYKYIYMNSGGTYEISSEKKEADEYQKKYLLRAAGIDFGDSEDFDCEGLLGETLLDFLKSYIFMPVQIAVPILFIVLTIIDFSKVVFTDDKDAMAKAKKKFMKRGIIAVAIFFIPSILNLIFNIVNQKYIDSCLNQFM